MENPSGIPPFREGERLKASKLESLRQQATKRVRGLFGRENAVSATTGPQKLQSLRERIQVINNTGTDIPAFSLFAVKRSGEINYPWGPPVRTEGFLFEHGFNYVTNYTYEMVSGTTEGHWCETVGHLPVLIRYDPEEGNPKIGHPIGPLESGALSIKRCGFVVVAEPDTENERVWVTRAASHDLRVKIVANILPNERGEVEVQDEELCGNDDGANDPDKIAPEKPFVIRKVLNLTGIPLKTDEIHYAKPILGIGYAIVGEYDPLFRVEARDCFYPGDEAEFLLYQLNIVTDEYEVVPDVLPIIEDDLKRFMLLTGEQVDAVIYLDECGTAKFKLLGTYGLTRQGKVKEEIECFATGEVYILGHLPNNCDGDGTCFVTACNGQTNEEGRRTLCVDEIVTLHYFENVWKILAQPHVTEWLGTLTSNLCPDDAVGQVSIDQGIGYCAGICSQDQTASADNLFTLSGLAGKRVLLGKYISEQTQLETYFIKQVQHSCKNIVVPQGSCGVGQGPTDGKFLTYESCEIKGNVLYSTSQMYCGEEALVTQLTMTEYDGLLDIQSNWDNCIITLNKYYQSWCAFEPTGNAPADDSETITFETATAYSDLLLEYDAGATSQDVCANPTLTLSGIANTVLKCGTSGALSAVTQLLLTESTAYYRAGTTTDSNGRKCVVLYPKSFITFGDCDEGAGDEIICGNPCPQDSAS